jgi:hypothetical protein
MGLKFKTSGSSDDALAQLLQLAQHSQNRTQRKKDDINSSLQSILELSKYATNVDSLTNIKNQWEAQKSSASEYEDTNVYYDLIGNVLQDRGAQITQYSNVVDQAQGIVNDADFLRQGSDFENLPKWVKSQVDEEGKPKYESVMQWVSDEYARIETISNTLESGSKLGFKRGKGIDDANIQTQMNQYKNRLNNTLEALIGDEAITAEEAQLIISGDRANFIQKRDDRLREIGSGIEEYDEIIQKFDDETIIDDLLEEADIFTGTEFEGFSFGDATESERKAVLKTLITERDKRIDNYEKWSGRQYAAAYTTIGELEEQEFEDAMGQEFDDEGEFTGEKDKQDIELEKFEELSPEEQRAQIEEKKKIGQKQYEESIKPKPISLKDAEKMGGKDLVDKYIKGEISEESFSNILDEMEDWDLSIAREINPSVYSIFGSEWTGGKDEILDLKGSQKEYGSILGLLPGMPGIDIGTGEEILEGGGEREKLPTSVKNYEDKVNYVKEVIDEWINIENENAGKSLKSLMEGNISMTEALNKASEGIKPAWGMSKRTEIWGGKARSAVNIFVKKFKDYKAKNPGITLDEFINQNQSEFNNAARYLKYGKTWRRSHK